MATVRYWNANYWNANYWEAGYWAQTATDDSIGQIAVTPQLLVGPSANKGSYFPTYYYADGYFADGYFAPGEPASGGTNFFGTFDPPTEFVGAISASTSVTATFTSSAAQVILFDLEVGFSPQWSFTQTSTYTGSMANTLDAMTSAIPGQFSADFIGPLATTLDDEAANFDGTHVAPGNVAGTIVRTMRPITSSFRGVFISEEGAIGSIVAATEAVTPNFDGQYITSNTSGTLSDTLDAYTVNWDGAFFTAATIVGPISDTLSDFDATFAGTSVGSQLIPTRRSNVSNTGRRRGTNTRRVA